MKGGAGSGRKRRSQERAEVTRGKLLNAALQIFSERGFDAVTVRDIEILAGVQRNLLNYHFGSKKMIWKEAATLVFDRARLFTRERKEVIGDLSARERLSYVIRTYVRFAAKNPELNRLMLQEGKQDSWRGQWLRDTFLKPSIVRLRELVEAEFALSDEEFIHWYYLFISGGGMVFSMAPEARCLFDKDVFDEGFVSRHCDWMVDYLLRLSARS